MSSFSVRAGNITSEDTIGFISLCDLNCDKCGIKQSILCHYKRQSPDNPTIDLNKKKLCTHDVDYHRNFRWNCVSNNGDGGMYQKPLEENQKSRF